MTWKCCNTRMVLKNGKRTQGNITNQPVITAVNCHQGLMFWVCRMTSSSRWALVTKGDLKLEICPIARFVSQKVPHSKAMHFPINISNDRPDRQCSVRCSAAPTQHRKKPGSWKLIQPRYRHLCNNHQKHSLLSVLLRSMDLP